MNTALPTFSRRETFAIGGVFLATILLLLVLQPSGATSPTEADPNRPPLSVHANDGRGARALVLWLAELGYQPVPIEYRPFAIDPEVRALFILAPTEEISEAHVAEIRSWVERGGVLVVATQRSNALLEAFGMSIASTGAEIHEAVLSQPLSPHIPLRRIEAKTTARLRPDEGAWVPLLGVPGVPRDLVAATASPGSGHVFVLAASHPLSNDGLRQADNWLLPLLFLAEVAPGSVVAFDEYHRGLTEHGAFGDRLLREPWGWAILGGGVIVFAYVALGGRRFGRAIPPAATEARRGRGEYVAALARRLRQERHTAWLRDQYASQIRRALAMRFGIRGDLPARAFAEAIASRRPEAMAIAAPLELLEGKRPLDEATVVRQIREIDAVYRRLVAS